MMRFLPWLAPLRGAAVAESNAGEKRMARLEETVFFQERLLQELNDALTAQQLQLDQLQQDLVRAQNRIQELHQSLDSGGGVDAGPPPHYAPQR